MPPPSLDPERDAFLLDVRFAWCDIINRGAERYAQILLAEGRDAREVPKWASFAGDIFDGMITAIMITNAQPDEKIDKALGTVLQPYTTDPGKKCLWGQIVHEFVANFTNSRIQNRGVLLWVRKVKPVLGWTDPQKTHDYLAQLIDAMERPME